MVSDPLKRHYPFQSHHLDLDGLAYHYLDEGSGPAVVMLHGNPSWSFYYRNLVRELSASYRCIVPDHIGCGLSDKPGDERYDYTLARRVQDLERLLDHLAIRDNITLVVHDWGGMIGMAYAVAHPRAIRRLVVMNTAAFQLPPGKPFPLALRICRDTRLGSLLVRGFNAFSLAASFVGCKRNPLSRELRRLYRLPYGSWNDRIATLRFVQDIPLKPGDRGFDLVNSVDRGLDQFRDLPLLLVWGERDFVFDRHFLAEWRRRFPQAEVHSYADAGHYILEDMKDEVVPIISAFLKRTE
ncbi:alpha/beta fold hydrolase [Pelobacter propionicus]|uniref:Alpha/beta hydrolase fold protein n=1 Tax=Pelobacter propionicus (strain DSM 2379 / NBRC 103807 / OttBd1) TaxID=338966 RepID=A1ATM7_PELPD|nr:alpha/beta fold hydrolase [Pelobacter propionicus]ABL00698.1 alpha/beta hydrolase fold protein [Pelobacter propionicus DSM 2379]